MRGFLHQSQVTYHCLVKFLGGIDELPANGIVFQIVPNPFVWIQFWRIGRKEKELQTILRRFHKTLHHFRLVGGMTIHDQKDHAFSIVSQTLQKVDKFGGPHSPFDCHKPELPLRANRRDQIESKSGTGAADYRGFALNRPRSPGMMIGSHPRLVSKEDHRLFSLGQSTNAGILFLQPLLNFFRSLLVCTPYRTLRSQSQLGQQPAHRRLAQLHPKFVINELPNHPRRPEGERELELQGVFLGNRFVYPVNRLRIKFGLAPTPFTGIKSVPTTLPISSEPTIHGRTAYTQCLKYGLRALSIVNATNSSFSEFGQHLMLKPSGIRRFHRRQAIINTISCLHNYETVNKLSLLVDTASRRPCCLSLAC